MPQTCSMRLLRAGSVEVAEVGVEVGGEVVVGGILLMPTASNEADGLGGATR